MSLRPKNAEVTGFQLALLRQVPKNRYVSAEEIRQKLSQDGIERSLRTIQRNLDQLSEQFDIERDMRNKPYGYKWKVNAKGIDLPILSEQQSLVLILAEQHLKHLLPANIMQSMKPFFEHAHRQLEQDSNQSKKLARQWLSDKIASTPTSMPLIPAKINTEVFNAVSIALYQNHWLKIEYRNQHNRISKSNVMPLAIAQQGATTYLIVRYEGYENNRLLALHRIQKAECSTMTFNRPKDFNLTDYLDSGYLGFGTTGNKVRLTFSISQSAGFHLTETPLSKDQKILEQSEEHYRIQATVAENDMLDWWIRRFGEDIWDIEKNVI
ncbi:helix-turn-helix transcriptional regulator [Ursidibacter sp. B-7004-1]